MIVLASNARPSEQPQPSNLDFIITFILTSRPAQVVTAFVFNSTVCSPVNPTCQLDVTLFNPTVHNVPNNLSTLYSRSLFTSFVTLLCPVSNQNNDLYQFNFTLLPARLTFYSSNLTSAQCVLLRLFSLIFKPTSQNPVSPRTHIDLLNLPGL